MSEEQSTLYQNNEGPVAVTDSLDDQRRIFCIQMAHQLTTAHPEFFLPMDLVRDYYSFLICDDPKIDRIPDDSGENVVSMSEYLQNNG
jgi:hypothetical protein